VGRSLPRLALAALTIVSSAAEPAGAAPATEPLVIAHRGASGERPEHTLAAYELALAEGADFIELDLVPSGDGVLIARHENALATVALTSEGTIARDANDRPQIVERTTDVAERPEFAERLTVKQIDGRRVGGWFSEDFTLAEIATLRARERMPELRPQNALHDDRYRIPTLADVIRLLRTHEQRGGRPAGLYLELKHPTYFRYEGRRLDGSPVAIDTAAVLLRELLDAAFPPERVFVQCFEVAPLIELKDRLAARGLSIRLIQLLGDIGNTRYRAVPRDLHYHLERPTAALYGELHNLIPGGLGADVSYAELATPAVLEFMARRYADGVGPNRFNLLTGVRREGGALVFDGGLDPFLARARDAGLLVHVWTLRAEAPFLLRAGGRLLTVDEEAALLLNGGVNGLFIDQPAEGRLAVDRWRAGRVSRNSPARELEADPSL
jgi:glycerophosphoryl diester phosphodiesterase